jgi:hypothetical protein
MKNCTEEEGNEWWSDNRLWRNETIPSWAQAQKKIVSSMYVVAYVVFDLFASHVVQTLLSHHSFDSILIC